MSADQYDKKKVLFTSKDIAMDLRTIISGENLCQDKSEPDEAPLSAAEKFDQGNNELDGPGGPEIDWQELDLSEKGHKGKGVWTEFSVCEGEVVTFIVSLPPALFGFGLVNSRNADRVFCPRDVPVPRVP